MHDGFVADASLNISVGAAVQAETVCRCTCIGSWTHERCRRSQARNACHSHYEAEHHAALAPAKAARPPLRACILGVGGTVRWMCAHCCARPCFVSCRVIGV